jgi:tetratricopeptide (TPR) repeat protein
MASRSLKVLIPTIVILAGFAVSVFLTGFAERSRPPLPAGYEDEDLALSGSQFVGFAFGAEGLIADWYWMNSLQYIGGKISTVGVDNLNLEDMTQLNPRLLYPYLNAATDLDPKFIAPYSYGATILPAIDSKQAIALTEKGIANNPTQWRLYQFLGYIYWRLGDYEKASEVYGKGSQIEGSPIFMRMMSARMKSEGGSRDIAREMYRQIRDQADDEKSRDNAELRLLQIDSLDERDVIDAALKEFLRANGRCPSNWAEVLPTLGRKPSGGRDLRIDRSNNIVDPAGVPYLLDREKCQAQINWPTSKIPPV